MKPKKKHYQNVYAWLNCANRFCHDAFGSASCIGASMGECVGIYGLWTDCIGSYAGYCICAGMPICTCGDCNAPYSLSGDH